MKRGLWWSICVFFVVSISACGPKKIVYFPQEWQTPPQSSQAATAQKSAVPNQQTASPPVASFLKRPPAIKESDVHEGPQTATTPARKDPSVKPPEHLASMHVVEQARTSLAQGRPDAAIPLLEKAIQVDGYNGEAFFGLARAWRMKGSHQKALEFARKAEILFQDDPRKLKEVYLFEADLYNDMGDIRQVELYRQKASKL
jgi:tetratricopeptide (TPR) repeat protein/predicted small lipoprotein YifL